VRKTCVLRNLERPQRHWKYCKLRIATLYCINVGIMLGLKDDCAFVHEGLTMVKLPAAEKHILWQNVVNHILPHQVKQTARKFPYGTSQCIWNFWCFLFQPPFLSALYLWCAFTLIPHKYAHSMISFLQIAPWQWYQYKEEIFWIVATKYVIFM
jgi:hypothetical protein